MRLSETRCRSPGQGQLVIVNVFGYAPDEYVEVVEKLNDCEGIWCLRTQYFLSCHGMRRHGFWHQSHTHAI
jgi:hypothetical protein